MKDCEGGSECFNNNSLVPTSGIVGLRFLKTIICLMLSNVMLTNPLKCVSLENLSTHSSGGSFTYPTSVHRDTFEVESMYCMVRINIVQYSGNNFIDSCVE